MQSPTAERTPERNTGLRNEPVLFSVEFYKDLAWHFYFRQEDHIGYIDEEDDLPIISQLTAALIYHDKPVVEVSKILAAYASNFPTFPCRSNGSATASEYVQALVRQFTCPDKYERHYHKRRRLYGGNRLTDPSLIKLKAVLALQELSWWELCKVILEQPEGWPRVDQLPQTHLSNVGYATNQDLVLNMVDAENDELKDKADAFDLERENLKKAMNRKYRDVEDARRALEQKDERLKAQDEVIADQERRFAETVWRTQSELAKVQKEAKDKDKEIAEKDSVIAEKEKVIAEKDRQLAEQI